VIGSIIKFDPNMRTGTVEDDDGLRYFFRALSIQWLPREGQEVEFTAGREGEQRVARDLVRIVKRSRR